MIAAWIIRLAGFAALLCVAGCAGQRPYSPDPAAAPLAAQPYRLAAGDKVHIITYNEPSLTGDFGINVNGDLAFPLIGTIKAAGQTPQDLQQTLTKTLGNGYLLNPRVSVEVLSYRPIYILGEVNKPGEYDYVPGMTVLAAIAKAEGFTYRAQEKSIFLKRQGSDREVEIRLHSDTPIHPGDTLRIGERYF